MRMTIFGIVDEADRTRVAETAEAEVFERLGDRDHLRLIQNSYECLVESNMQNPYRELDPSVPPASACY